MVSLSHVQFKENINYRCVLISVFTTIAGMQSREERSKQYFDTDIIGAAGYTPDGTDELFDRVSEFFKVDCCVLYK